MQVDCSCFTVHIYRYLIYFLFSTWLLLALFPLVNKLTTSMLTIQLLWIGTPEIDFTKHSEFLTYDKYFSLSWLYLPGKICYKSQWNTNYLFLLFMKYFLCFKSSFYFSCQHFKISKELNFVHGRPFFFFLNISF